MEKGKYLFGDIVVVDEKNIGVILKSWERMNGEKKGSYYYDIYVRLENRIREYDESEIERYRVRHKYLSEEELMYQD